MRLGNVTMWDWVYGRGIVDVCKVEYMKLIFCIWEVGW